MSLRTPRPRDVMPGICEIRALNSWTMCAIMLCQQRAPNSFRRELAAALKPFSMASLESGIFPRNTSNREHRRPSKTDSARRRRAGRRIDTPHYNRRY